MAIYYKFWIDGVVIPEPGNIGGWEKLVTNIKRDSSELKGILVSQDVELTFTGDQYEFFRSAYFNLGICAEFPTLIQQSYDDINYSTLHRGIIKLRDVKLVDMLKGVATAKINDDSFYARINNNKSIGTNLRGGWSKNGEPITACPHFNTQLYNPIDNTAAVVRRTISVHNAMEYLIRFMSDDEVAFRSDFLDTGLPMVIQQGGIIRTNTVPQPYWEVSFAQLFKNISRLRKIGWQIEYDINEKPIFRLELAEYFYSQTAATDSDGNEIIFSDPETMPTSVDANELYGKLKIGSSIIEDLPTLTFPEDTRFNGVKEEDFYVLGQCNIDSTLDLTKDFVISSNVIEFIINQIGLGSPDTSHDDDLILIVTDDNTLLTAKMTNPFGAVPPAFYNMDLRNSQVALSYFNIFQGGLVAGFLNSISNDFQGYKTIQELKMNWCPYNTGCGPYLGDPNFFPYSPDPPLLINPIIYQSEVDVNNNFNPATGTYTCPATGWYTFNLYAPYDLTGMIGDGTDSVTVGFGIDSSAGVLATVAETHFNNVSDVANLSCSVFLNSGTTVTSFYTLLDTETDVTRPPSAKIWRLLPGTKFSSTSTPDTGGTVATYDPQDIRNVFMSFKYSIGAKLFDSIKSQLTRQYSIYSSVLNKTFKGWIDKITYPHIDGHADVIIKTSIRTINPEVEANRLQLPAYKFEFDMTDQTDELNDFTYNGGASTVNVNYPLSQTELLVRNAIETAFAGAGITFDEIIIHRTSIAGARFHYVIIITNPNFDIGLIGYDGTNVASSFFYY